MARFLIMYQMSKYDRFEIYECVFAGEAREKFDELVGKGAWCVKVRYIEEICRFQQMAPLDFVRKDDLNDWFNTFENSESEDTESEEN